MIGKEAICNEMNVEWFERREECTDRDFFSELSTLTY